MENKSNVEKIAKILYGHYCGKDACGDCKQPRCVDYIRAEKLTKEGIRDVKQAVREFAENLKKLLIEEYTTPCFNREGKPIFDFNPDFYDKFDELVKGVCGE